MSEREQSQEREGGETPSRAAVEGGRTTAGPERTNGHRSDTHRSGSHTSTESGLVGRGSDVTPVLSVVLPTLNEEDGIRECIQRIKTSVEELGVVAEVIVSDASTDRTPEIARKEGAIVVKPDQPGYGYAYRYGFNYVRGQYVVLGDADTTYDFEELPKLYRHVAEGDADIAMGSRLDGEIKPGAMPALHQYVGNPLLTAFLNVFYDAGVSDAHSGFRVIDRDVLERLDVHSDGMEFASEMIMDAADKGFTIVEEPITYHEREGEATLDSFRDGWRHVKFMLVNAPGYLFSVPAALLAFAGTLVLGMSLLGTDVGPVYFGRHTALAGSLFIILAHQLGSLAIASGVVGEPIRVPEGPFTQWMLDNFRLEHGVTLGLAGVLGGGAYAAYGIVRWLTVGTQSLLITTNLVAFTVIVLGVQTLFYSFFLSMVAEVRGEPISFDQTDVTVADDD